MYVLFHVLHMHSSNEPFKPFRDLFVQFVSSLRFYILCPVCLLYVQFTRQHIEYVSARCTYFLQHSFINKIFKVS